MAGMTADQRLEARRWVGSAPADSVLDDNYDRLGTVRGVVVEILETRYADMIRTPSSFTIVGEYSQTTAAENLKLARAWLDQAKGATFDTDGDGPAVTTKRLVRAPYDDYVGR